MKPQKKNLQNLADALKNNLMRRKAERKNETKEVKQKDDTNSNKQAI